MAILVALWVAITTFPRSLGLAVLHRTLSPLALWPSDFLESLLGTAIQSGMLPQLWFLWSLAIVYLLLPPLSRLSTNGKLNLFIALCVVGIAIQALSYVLHSPVDSYIPQVVRVWIWVKFFLFGGLLYEKRSSFTLRSSSAVSLALLVSVAAIFVQLFAGSTFLITAGGSLTHAEYFYDSIVSVLWSGILLLAVESLHPRKSVWSDLSSLTMGVYIIHTLVIRACGHFLDFANPLIGSGIGFLVVLCISFACVRLIKPTKLFDILCKI